jgi:hypothetical protein
MKNNKKKTIKKKIKGGAPLAVVKTAGVPPAATKTPSIQIEGLDLSFIHKLGSAGAKLIAGGIVFGVEQMFAAIASRSPKPLSKDTIHGSIQILNQKLASVEVFIKSPEGQLVVRNLNSKLTILAKELAKVASGPLKILMNSLLDLMLETGEKFIQKGTKFSKNILRIVPGAGDAFIIAENIGTAATAGSQGITSFIESWGLLSKFLEKSGGNFIQITSTINELRKSIEPIISIFTSGPQMLVNKAMPGVDLKKIIEGGTEELNKNIERVTNATLTGLNQGSGNRLSGGGTRRRKRRTRKTKKNKK